jgi:hypothetical protein
MLHASHKSSTLSDKLGLFNWQIDRRENATSLTFSARATPRSRLSKSPRAFFYTSPLNPHDDIGQTSLSRSASVKWSASFLF